MTNEEQIKQLESDLALYTAQKDQLQANLNASIGAIGAVQRLIERLKSTPENKAEAQDSKKIKKPKA